jgi:hypothetical protein
VGVTAKDENGQSLDWIVASSAPNVVGAVKNKGAIALTGRSLGSALITVTTQPGPRPLQRSVPVQVYDSSVLDVGGFLIKYIDTFQCIPGTPAYPESFYHPVVPDGWYALGSFRDAEKGCPNIDGKQWMMVVKENATRAAARLSRQDLDEHRPNWRQLLDPARSRSRARCVHDRDHCGHAAAVCLRSEHRHATINPTLGGAPVLSATSWILRVAPLGACLPRGLRRDGDCGDDR